MKQSLAALAEANVPASLREVAFAKTFDLIARGGSPQGKRGENPRSTGGDPVGGGDGSPGLQKIATALKIDGNLIGDFFREDGDELWLSLHHSELGSQIKTQVGNGALLVVAGRQYGGYDSSSPTSYKVLQERLKDYWVVDSNFSSNVKAVTNNFVVSGTGKNATYKLRSPGRTAAAKFVGKVLEAR